MLETALVLATVVPQYRFTLVPGQDIVPVPTFTLRPKAGIEVVLQKR